MSTRHPVNMASSGADMFPTGLMHRKRAPLKTYSRQPKRVLIDSPEPATKQRRPATPEASGAGESKENVPSSESIMSSPYSTSAPVSSDPAEYIICGTPSSSPLLRSPSALFRPHKPTFSFLKRRQPSRTAPDESTIIVDTRILANITNRADGPGPPKKRQRLMQMQIDLGGELRESCKTCGMEYVPSNVDDVALHKKFHAMNVGGVDLGKNFAKGTVRVIWDSTTAEDASEKNSTGFVVVVERKSSMTDKNKARKVLKVVSTELSAVAIKDGDLWGQVANGNEKGDRFKVYLYMIGERCVGLCLAERIQEARKVVGRASSCGKSSSISVSDKSFPAVLGISRIWTSKSCRRQGVAHRLLECAASNFIYGMSVPKAMMAFSQPTESGGLLADKWFDGIRDWAVYTE